MVAHLEAKSSIDGEKETFRKKDGLVSRRIEMYEAPLRRQGRQGSRTSLTDSFALTGDDEEREEERDDSRKASRNKYVGSVLVETGVKYYAKGEYEKARKAFTAALKAQRASYKGNNVAIALTLGNLGSVYLQQGILDEAERVLEEALYIKKVIAPDLIHADTLNNLGNCANLRGDYELSLAFYKDALDDLLMKNGKRSEIVNSLFNVGRLQIQMQQWDDALRTLKETYSQTREIYGKQHFFVAQTLDLIGFVQLSTLEFDAAMLSFTAALAIHRKLFGPTHMEIANSLFNIGMVKEARGDLADAWEAYTTARDIYDRTGTDQNHPGFLTVRKSLATIEKAIAKKNQQRLISKHARVQRKAIKPRIIRQHE